jgi:hypothetical protein
MRRRTFDALATAAGLVMAAVLLVAGILLGWGHSFVTSEVHTQLAAQQIFFPPAGSPAIKAPEFAAMHQYAGQQMTTGAQAEVYADHFIANHLKAIGGGKTYAQLSAESLAQPKNAALAAQVQTVFRGETLRGLRRRGPPADPVRPGLHPRAAHRPEDRGLPQADHPQGGGHHQLTATSPIGPAGPAWRGLSAWEAAQPVVTSAFTGMSPGSASIRCRLTAR